MEEFNIADVSKKMQAACDALGREYKGLRSGRAAPALLDPVVVDAYGSRMPLSQVGTVAAPEPRLLTVSVWDASLVKAVEKGITEAGLGLNPMSEGQLVRVTLPELSEERRAELVKVASKYAEQSRISIRNVRRDAIDSLRSGQKAGDISEDDLHRESQAIQKLTDQHIKHVDDVFESKEKEIMTV